MKLSRAGEYGILGAAYIAQQDKEISFIREIAGAWGLPESFLAKVLQKLAKAGILESHKGNMGGFSLARPADEITLCEIIEALQDPIVASGFEEREDPDRRMELPPLEPIIHEATDKVRDVFREYTIADLTMVKAVE
ncbi:MAG: Rrf2 family transcriptional regulator [bacterium]|nr:Rrf2 family transcriptional regulator [bacterium]